jgi:hypothetical protein
LLNLAPNASQLSNGSMSTKCFGNIFQSTKAGIAFNETRSSITDVFLSNIKYASLANVKNKRPLF